jgi:hypothetical protein
MRITFHSALVLLAFPATAQLTNPSFELVGIPGVPGWEWTCATPGLVNNAAPSSGSWHATKEAGQTQGCFPSHLFQRIPGYANGAVVTLAGWVRCDSTPPCLGAYIGLGTVNNGLFQLEENTGTMSSAWTWVSITDTVQYGAGDTAIVVLNAGLIGGPVNPTPGHFDGLELQLATAIEANDADVFHHRYDAENARLSVSCGSAALFRLQLFDATGRELPVRWIHRDRSQATVDASDLRTGLYLVRVATATNERVLRFVRR